MASERRCNGCYRLPRRLLELLELLFHRLFRQRKILAVSRYCLLPLPAEDETQKLLKLWVDRLAWHPVKIEVDLQQHRVGAILHILDGQGYIWRARLLRNGERLSLRSQKHDAAVPDAVRILRYVDHQLVGGNLQGAVRTSVIRILL